MRTRGWVLFGLVPTVVSPGCERGEAPPTTAAAGIDDQPAKSAPPLSTAAVGEPLVGFVLVRAGSKLYVDGDGDEALPLVAADDPALPPTYAMRYSATGATRLSLVSLGGRHAGHCGRPLRGLEAVALRVFVDPDALVPVVAAPHEQEFGDGTSVALVPGVALHPAAADDAFIADAAGVLSEVVVPRAARGLSYKPLKTFEARDGGERIAQAEPILIGSYRLRGTDHLFGGATPSAVRGEPTQHGHASGGGARTTVTVRGRCVEATGSVAVGALQPKPAAVALLDAATDGAEPPSPSPAPGRFEVGEGVALQWCRGGAAGMTNAALRLAAAPRVEGKQRCFDIASEDLTAPACLCVDEQAVVAVADVTIDAAQLARVAVARTSLSVSAGLSDKSVSDRLDAKDPDLATCYLRHGAEANDPQLGVAIRLAVDPSGVVKVASVDDSSVRDRAVANCVAKAAQDWTFGPTAGGNVVVKVGWVLRTRSSPNPATLRP